MAEAVNFNTLLKDIFPGISDEEVNNIIGLVQEANPNDSDMGKLENMVNLLSGDGAWGGPMPDNFFNPVITQEDEIPVQAVNENALNKLYGDLISIFPDASPDFIWKFCRDHRDYDSAEAVEKLSEIGYEKIEVDPLTIWEQLKSALPGADPGYLREEAGKLAVMTPQDMDIFLQNAIEKNDYPTMKDYMKRRKEHDELAIYKNHFNVEEFIEIIPNPDDFFAGSNRKLSLDENSNEIDVNYALTFLYNHYNFIRKKHIDKLFKWKNRNLVEICEKLDKLHKNMRRPRPVEEAEDTKNVALLQEIAYLKNRKLIRRVLKDNDEMYRYQKEEARKYNLLRECQCCFEEELIPEECYFCQNGCVFCKVCVRSGVQTDIGLGKLRFRCFADCGSEFSVQTIQMVLPKKIFERIIQKIASEEIKNANVDGLETCPFCDFAMILPNDEKLFRCINNECLVESCRECRHQSHVPLRCNEIEYDEDVRRRTFIENKMTEALTRTCYNCKKTFIKSTGCNKMTCTCGALMCYLCGAAVRNYSHFNDKTCPLFTNDAQINLQRVVAGAQKAKAELGNVEVKFDPSANIENYYTA